MLRNYTKNLRQAAGRDERHVSFDKLANAAGVHVSGSVCPECGSEMKKSGSLMKCSCGMMKKANTLLERGVSGALLGGMAGGVVGHGLRHPDRNSLRGAAQGAVGGAIPGAVAGLIPGLGGVLASGAAGALGGARASQIGLSPQEHAQWDQAMADEEKQDMLMGHGQLNQPQEKTATSRMLGLLAQHMQKHAELWQPGVLEQGHAGEGEKLRLLPALGDTPDEGGPRREEQLGERRHPETKEVEGGTETGVRDIGVGPSGLTYELTNAQLVKKAVAGMPGRR